MAVNSRHSLHPAQQLAELEQQVENLLIARNVRGMAQLQPALRPGYLKRAARLLYQPAQSVMITTGFPVGQTFESDGPLGALMIAQMLQRCQIQTDWVCGPPLSTVLPAILQQLFQQPTTGHGFGQVMSLPLGAGSAAELAPILAGCYAAALSIERPGKASDGFYYNMRRENISQRIADVDALWRCLTCPTVAVGDGGNEIGMGKIYQSVQTLDIEPAATSCDELVLADVSNWAAYGFAFYWSLWSGQDLFALLNPTELLQLLLQHGCVDGVTRLPNLTEDGFELSAGQALCQQIYQLYQQASAIRTSDRSMQNTADC